MPDDSGHGPAARHQPSTAQPDAAAGDDLPSLADLEAAERLFGVAFRTEQRDQVRRAWVDHGRGVRATRLLELPHDLAPAVAFSPLLPDSPLPRADAGAGTLVPEPVEPNESPSAAHAVHRTVVEIAASLRAGHFSALDLTRAYLERIDRLDPALKAYVTVLPERALAEAAQADRERAAGSDLGPLHGIPYAAKDLLAVADAPTTWGAVPYREQMLAETATTVSRLRAAGAVLLGKTALGALAMGDVWFGGTTRNPWNPDEGSSGSSAGSAAAVAAGLCAFALGSETMGSILSPAGRCGVVGLRPTFGRVSRHGAMPLSWSLDRLGPLTRSPADAALVLAAIGGPDGRDGTVHDVPFPWDPRTDPDGLRVGVPTDALEDPDPALDRFLEIAATWGTTARPVRLPDLPFEPIMTILMVEASAAFDQLVRSGRAESLTRQDDAAWPTLLRAARLTSATDYVQAQRLRRRMQVEMAALFEDIDVLVTPNGHEGAMVLGNAVGFPAVSIPCGAGVEGRPLGNVALLARAFFDHHALALAHAVRGVEGPLATPPRFGLG